MASYEELKHFYEEDPDLFMHELSASTIWVRHNYANVLILRQWDHDDPRKWTAMVLKQRHKYRFTGTKAKALQWAVDTLKSFEYDELARPIWDEDEETEKASSDEA